MVELMDLQISTTKYNELINITKEIEQCVDSSGIQRGVVFIITMHTTTGIAVNESLECLEYDLIKYLGDAVPEDGFYVHARMLHSYGTSAGNATGHLKSHLTGSSVVFPIESGKLVRGSAQDIYLCEFDGAQIRTLKVVLMGE